MCGTDDPSIAVERDGRLAEPVVHPRRHPGRSERELLGRCALEVRRELHPVVRPAPLLGEHRDRPPALGVARGHGLHEALADHAVSDHNQPHHATASVS
jgi:hypothetical protein